MKTQKNKPLQLKKQKVTKLQPASMAALKGGDIKNLSLNGEKCPTKKTN